MRGIVKKTKLSEICKASNFTLGVAKDEKLYRYSCCNLRERGERNLPIITTQKRMMETVLFQRRVMIRIRLSLLKIKILVMLLMHPDVKEKDKN